MLVLGVESSCDETALALVHDGQRVVASQVASQLSVHAPFGGVVPEIAAREHLSCIHQLWQQCLAEADVEARSIDAVAVTQGPGLIGALLVGISFAKGLSLALKRPLIAVDHVHAHIHGALLGLNTQNAVAAEFPALALVVSGGHTNLYKMQHATDFQLLAASVDDACGESFDKVAKLLGFPYPGGPAIETCAQSGNAKAVAMPRMLDDRNKMSFSYSGLKTHMARLIRQEELLSEARKADICAAFQEEALGQLIRKLSHAIGLYPEVRSLLVAGGVAANSRFRTLVHEKLNVPAVFPPLAYCSDNAAMIATLGYHQLRAKGITTTQRSGSGTQPRVADEFDAYTRHEDRPHG